MTKILSIIALAAFLIIASPTPSMAHCGVCEASESGDMKPCTKDIKSGKKCDCGMKKKSCCSKDGKKPCEKVLGEKKPCNKYGKSEHAHKMKKKHGTKHSMSSGATASPSTSQGNSKGSFVFQSGKSFPSSGN
jgi:hypothetical protein